MTIFNKPFEIWKLTTALSSQGRTVERFAFSGTNLTGILASATPDERLLYSQPNHDVTYTIVHRGPPIARIGDYLRLADENYHIQSVQDPGRIARWTIYYCDFRRADPADLADPNV